ncbi:hypothetical protein pb186bvf_000675 [Paramecium bursaria]
MYLIILQNLYILQFQCQFQKGKFIYLVQKGIHPIMLIRKRKNKILRLIIIIEQEFETKKALYMQKEIEKSTQAFKTERTVGKVQTKNKSASSCHLPQTEQPKHQSQTLDVRSNTHLINKAIVDEKSQSRSIQKKQYFINEETLKALQKIILQTYSIRMPVDFIETQPNIIEIQQIILQSTLQLKMGYKEKEKKIII